MISAIGVGHELDVATAQGRRPPPVVAQGALGEGREVRGHLLEERVVLDLGAQDVEQHGTNEVVGGAHRLGGPVPRRVDPGRHKQPLVHEPELPQPVPAAVIGQELKQVMELRRERVAVVLRRQQPGWGPLIDVEVAHLSHQARDELGRARPRADHRDAPPGQLHRVVPVRRVERRALEALPAVDGGKGRAVELAHGADDGVGDLGGLAAVFGPHRQRPLACGLVEAGLRHLAPEPDVLPEPQLLGGRLQVRQQVRPAPRSGTASRSKPGRRKTL